jgi:hypothetical protein
VLQVSNPADMLDALRTLPKDLSDAYKAVIERIPPNTRSFAFQILSWICHTPRPLTMDELCEAVVIRPGQKVFEDKLLPDPERILAGGAGFVIHEQDTGIVRFAHYTMQKYLEDHQADNLRPPADLAITCLTYLGFELFDGPALDAKEQVRKFMNHAAQCWRLYAEGAMNSETIHNLIYAAFRSARRRKLIYSLSLERSVVGMQVDNLGFGTDGEGFYDVLVHHNDRYTTRVHSNI